MPQAKRQRFRYDAFMSYSHHNKDWVRGWFVQQLKDAGLKICIDYENFEPGAPSIMEMERAVLQSRKTVLVLTPEYLQSEWAEFENILVQTLDPAAHRGRLVPVLLAPCDLPLRLEILTYVDFTSAQAQADNISRVVTSIRRRLPAVGSRRVEIAAHLSFELPTGALSPDSRFYIERHHDRVMRRQVTLQGSTTIIEGARQMGKSSLVVRALAHARAQQCVVIDFDFQDLDESCLHDLETLLRYLADAMCERLRLAISPEDVWRGPLGAKDKLTSYVREYVLQGVRMPVVLVIDEVDRVLGRPYYDDFFGLLRAWHNRRARDPLWAKFNMVLSYSTDPRQVIRDPNQSPFNVGTKLQLDDFTFDDVWELNRRYDKPLKRKNQLKALMEVIGGHPHLVQQALYTLADKTHTLPVLLDTTHVAAGPFIDHLQHYERRLEAEPALKQGMRQALMNGTCPQGGVCSRLRSMGLITGVSHDTVAPRCRLYVAYFQRALS